MIGTCILVVDGLELKFRVSFCVGVIVFLTSLA